MKVDFAAITDKTDKNMHATQPFAGLPVCIYRGLIINKKIKIMLIKRNHTFKKKIVVYAVVIATFALIPMGGVVSNVANAATDTAEITGSHPNKGNHFAIGHYKKMFADRPFQGVAVIGTVFSINLTNIVVKDKNNISYTVDALNAKITNGLGKHAQIISIDWSSGHCFGNFRFRDFNFQVGEKFW